jgi:hypothetical protein
MVAYDSAALLYWGDELISVALEGITEFANEHVVRSN